MGLDHVKNDACCADTVDGKDLSSGLCTRLQDVLEDLPLRLQRSIEAWSSIKADLADVPRLRKIFVPNRKFIGSLRDELGVKSQRRTDVTGRTRQFMISRPSLGRRRHCQCEHIGTFTFGDRL